MRAALKELQRRQSDAMAAHAGVQQLHQVASAQVGKLKGELAHHQREAEQLHGERAQAAGELAALRKDLKAALTQQERLQDQAAQLSARLRQVASMRRAECRARQRLQRKLAELRDSAGGRSSFSSQDGL